MAVYKVSEDVHPRLYEPDPVQRILQNVAVILKTELGSVPMYRSFGLSSGTLDLPMPAAKAVLLAQIVQAVREFEPRANVRGITFEENNDTGTLSPVVEVEINLE